MIYFLLAALGAFAFLAKSPSQPTANVNGLTLPWGPPIAGLASPKKTRSRDVSVTPFPVDVWAWVVPAKSSATPAMSYVLAVASDDPSSFIAYIVQSGKSKTVIAKGPGPLTPQILAQV